MNYQGQAELVDETGTTFEVYALLTRRVDRGGIQSWDGAVRSRTSEPLLLNGGQFTLRLPDGREGVAMVQPSTSWRRGAGISERISVKGSGPAPF